MHIDRREFIEKYLFFGLLGLIILALCLSPFSQDTHHTMVVINGLFLLSLFVCAGIVSKKKSTLIVLLILGLPTLLLDLSSMVTRDSMLVIFTLISAVLFYLTVTVLLLYKIFTSKIVNLNILLGSVSVYFLLGIIWSILYVLFGRLYTNAFSTEITNALDLVYFSFTTLTTLGFGDITPIAAPVKSLSIMEATTGQIYLSIIIARLVGLYIKDH